MAGLFFLTMWKENMIQGSFGRSYDPHLLITKIWQERSEDYFLANSVTRFHCSAVKWYTSCLNLWLCLDFSGFHQNCPPRRFVTIELLIPAVQPTRTAFLTLRYQKSEESQYQTMSCWCNHTPFDCHNFGTMVRAFILRHDIGNGNGSDICGDMFARKRHKSSLSWENWCLAHVFRCKIAGYCYRHLPHK